MFIFGRDFYKYLISNHKLKELAQLPVLASNLLMYKGENKTLSSSEPNGLPHRLGFLLFRGEAIFFLFGKHARKWTGFPGCRCLHCLVRPTLMSADPPKSSRRFE
jgi:hypothetical protein